MPPPRVKTGGRDPQARRRFPTEAQVKRQANAVRAAGLEIAALETFPDGHIRFDTRLPLSLPSAKEDADAALAEFEAGLKAPRRV